MGKSTYEQVRASIAKHKDRVSLNLPKGQLPRIKDIAPGGNVTAYIQALINADFERRDGGPDAGQDASQPDVAAEEDTGRVRFSISAAAIEDLRGPDETPAAAAVRVFRLGIAAARAPQGERGAPEQGGLTTQLQKK